MTSSVGLPNVRKELAMYCHCIWPQHSYDLFKSDTRSHLHPPIGFDIGLQLLSKHKFLERYGIAFFLSPAFGGAAL